MINDGKDRSALQWEQTQSWRSKVYNSSAPLKPRNADLFQAVAENNAETSDSWKYVCVRRLPFLPLTSGAFSLPHPSPSSTSCGFQYRPKCIVTELDIRQHNLVGFWDRRWNIAAYKPHEIEVRCIKHVFVVQELDVVVPYPVS